MKKQMLVALLLGALTACMIKCNSLPLSQSTFEAFNLKKVERETNKENTTIFLSHWLPNGNEIAMSCNNIIGIENIQFNQKIFL